MCYFAAMVSTKIIIAIDEAIARLEQARATLTDEDSAVASPSKKKPRPKSGSQKKGSRAALSGEARARIAAAQKKRWQKQKKA